LFFNARPAVFADVGQGIGSQLSLPGVFSSNESESMNETLKTKIRSALDVGWEFMPDLTNGSVIMHHPDCSPVPLVQDVASLSQGTQRITRSQPAFGLRRQPELSQQAVMISPLRTASQ
jgi:hypothetical protein